MTQLNRTPLWANHKQLGARLIDFGGWEMPVSYPAGTIKEHHAVRNAVGLFDVSHMGEFSITGPGAKAFVDRMTTNAVGAAAPGKAVYTLLCRADGGIVDDCIFYKRSDDNYFVIVNASNIAKDWGHLREHAPADVTLTDLSAQTALIAVQGPKALGLLDSLVRNTDTSTPVSQLASFTFLDCTVAGVACTLARTGYTGEDGVEIACPNEAAPALWQALLEAATPLGGLPIGLGARDTLRLEAKLPLYGNDIDDQTTPLEAGLGWAVKLDKGEFLGRARLATQKAEGLTKQLVGFVIAPDLRAIARHGYEVISRDAAGTKTVIGKVTSGAPGVVVPGAIGLAYVPTALAAAGTTLTLDCRGKDIPATVVAGKFYKRKA